MLSAKDVADYILYQSFQDEDPVSNMKLQKLMYYYQGFHLAMFDKPVFEEDIHKWTHGPVVPEIYHLYKNYGSAPIYSPERLDTGKYSEDVRELFDEVYSVYGQFSASGLRNLTHQEPPWVNAADGQVISLESMKEYFKTRISD